MRDPWTQAKLWRQSRGRDEVEAKIEALRRDGAAYLADILEEVGPQRTGSWRTNAIPGLSWHQLGKAVDFGVRSPTSRRVLMGDRDEDGDEFQFAERSFARMGALCPNYGLTWGGHFGTPDENHVQATPAGSPLDEMSLQDIDAETRRLWPARPQDD
jgi:hypothetical protein